MIYKKSDAFFLFKQIQICFGKSCKDSFSGLDLTHSQAHLLMYITCSGQKEITQRDIEKKFGLSNPTVTGILKRLEAKGFITRHISENDNRYKIISITDKSKEICSNVKISIQAAENKLFDKMNESEINSLCLMFEKMLANISDSNHITTEE